MTISKKLKLKHLSIIFAIAGISILYLISILVQPAVIELENIGNFENKNVIVEGVVTNYYLTQYGNQIITIKDNTSSAIIFLETSKDIEYGDKIRATGKVQKFGNDWEIVVNNNRFVKVIQKWANISTPIWQLAQNPEKYVGLNINITGSVDSIFDDYLYIADKNSTHQLIIFYNSYNYNDLWPGQEITIAGKFDFDANNLRYGLYLLDHNHKITTTTG